MAEDRMAVLDMLRTILNGRHAGTLRSVAVV